MATVTDTLLTIFEIQGAAKLVNSFNQATKSVEALSKVTKNQQSTVKQQDKALQAVGDSFQTLGKTIEEFLIRQVIAFSVKAVEAFAEYEQQVFRTTLVLRNLGNSFPIERAQSLAKSLSDTAAVSQGEIVALVGLEKRFKVADSQIEATTKTLVDFAKGSSLEIEQVGQALGHALAGRPQLLKSLGVEFTKTGDRAKDLAAILQSMQDLTVGGAEAQRNTLSGSFDALKIAMNSLLIDVGGSLATILIPAIHALTAAVRFLKDNIFLLTGVLSFIPAPKNPAEAIGTGKGKLATEDTLKEVADNTKGTNEALIKAVLGGSLSTFARGGANARDFQLAFRA